MKDLNLKELLKKFDSMDEKQQWQFILDHKEDLFIYLDNDNTTAHFLDGRFDEEIQGDYNCFVLKADIGNRWGLEFLLDVVGIKWNHC